MSNVLRRRVAVRKSPVNSPRPWIVLYANTRGAWGGWSDHATHAAAIRQAHELAVTFQAGGLG